jgi:ribosomal protein S18 acetylase RimI-like enzyme
VRPVRVEEVSLALSMILGTRGVPAESSGIAEFMKYAAGRGLSLVLIWVAVKEDIMGWAALPMLSPGRTVMLRGADATMIADPSAVTAGVETVCRHFAGQNAQLIQVLVDPAESATAAMYTGRGFTPMAELLYMHRAFRRTAMPALPVGVRLLNYSESTHALFAAGILASYEQSLDCPQLNGVRDIEDVILGHKSAGLFDPGDWFVVVEAGNPIAVLLMTRVNNMDGMEIVYVGIKPSSRGRGRGDYLIRLAAGHATLRKCRHIALAVDAQNRPAIAMYQRHGFERSTSRVALMRELHPRSSGGG